MNHKPNLKLFVAALLVAIGLLIPYEYYFRYIEVWPVGYDNNPELWAIQRRKVDKLTPDDVVIVGSSRGHFDANIHLFDSVTGHRPVMLAIPGGSPYYTMEDIVQNTNFKGLLIVSVAPGLFFTTGSSGSAEWVKAERVEFTHKQTYASRFSQSVYMLINPLFCYLDPEIALKSLIYRLPFPDRDSVEHEAVWPPMVTFDQYRSVRMNVGMETDTALQNWQTRIWHRPNWKNRFADSSEVILNHYASLAQTFQARGGRVAYIRPPVTGEYLEHEPKLWPREQYWDELLKRSGAKGYHYDDYPETKDMIPPEWSHLNRRDSDIYTRTLIKLLQQDGLL
jgi:hypothetical protein